jgi:four helix bundle protein
MMDLKERTMQFTLDILDLVDELEYSVSKKVVANQLARSGSSVGANYRASCRSRSDKEFVSKMNIVLEEADESAFWLEVMKRKGWKKVDRLLKEANELTAITVASLKTTKARMNSKK